MRFIVRPRYAVGKLDLDVPYVVISITDIGDSANIPQRWGLRGILRLEFEDLDPDRFPETYPESWKEQVMKPQHAWAIWDFVQKHINDVGAIVIHCEAGASRSPSVAMALADCLHFPRTTIDWLKDWVDADPPNLHVYGMMRKTQPTIEVACAHPGCRSHASHPCEGCGRQW